MKRKLERKVVSRNMGLNTRLTVEHIAIVTRESFQGSQTGFIYTVELVLSL